MTITDFLLARIDEDEVGATEAAEDVGGPSWKIHVEPFEGWWPEPMRPGCQRGYEGGWMNHVEHHDPARVLAECEAKRRIVEWYATLTARLDNGEANSVNESVHHLASVIEATDVVRALAAVYADHPDYAEAWSL